MIAHMRESDYKIQTVQEHLKAVSFLAKKYGEKARFEASAELAGLLHDMGKNTEAFSQYITDAVKETGAPLERIDHSTAGAKYLYETYYVEKPSNQVEMMTNYTIEMIGMTILSHHSGLQNFVQTDGSQSDYFRRVCREDLPYYDEVRTEFLRIKENEEAVKKLLTQATKELTAFSVKVSEIFKEYDNGKTSPFLYFSLAMKYIFSCLIDADRTDSRRFDEGDTSELWHSNQDFFKKVMKTSWNKSISGQMGKMRKNQSIDYELRCLIDVMKWRKNLRIFINYQFQQVAEKRMRVCVTH